MIIDQLCPFCFAHTNGASPCPVCHHYKGEPRDDMQTLPPGTILDGKYILGMVLGRGGFGITYLAYDLNLNQKIAIKEYFPSSLVSRHRQYIVPNIQADTPVFKRGVESFFMEAQTLAKFQYHPNIVKVLSFFEENNTAYIVMEYVEGKTLKEYMSLYGKDYEDGNLWDISLEELSNGSIEPNTDIEYWYINGRLYETNKEVK